MYLQSNDNMIHQGTIPGVSSATNAIYCADNLICNSNIMMYVTWENTISNTAIRITTRQCKSGACIAPIIQ